jgi:hypothetical protein
MMWPPRSSLLLSSLILVMATAFASSSEPPVGSSGRREVLEALRPSLEADLSAPIGFRVSRIEVVGDWAYVSCIPTRGREPLDWSTTKFAEAHAKDMMSEMVLALLYREATGRWRVIEYALGPTDVAWEDWIPKYRLPRTLFLPANAAPDTRDPATAPIEGVESTMPAEGAPNREPASNSDIDAALDAALSSMPPVTAAPEVRPVAPVSPAPEVRPVVPVPPSPTVRATGWSPPPDNTGYELLPKAEGRVIARNGGVGAVTLGATRPSVFRTLSSYRVEQVMTYHYGANQRPGSIALRHADGTVYGPWQAAGAVGQGNVRDAYWWVRPDVVIKPGRYTVLDSDPSTWAREAITKGAGIFEIRGQPAR